MGWSTDHKYLLHFVKVLAPVTDASWSLFEFKMVLCPRQDPDGDPVPYVNVTHRLSREHWRPQSRTERDLLSNSTLLVKTTLSSPVLTNRTVWADAFTTGAKMRQFTKTAAKDSMASIASHRTWCKSWRACRGMGNSPTRCGELLRCGSEVGTVSASLYLYIYLAHA